MKQVDMKLVDMKRIKRFALYLCLTLLVSVSDAKSIQFSVESGEYDRENTVIRTEIPILGNTKDGNANRGNAVIDYTNGGNSNKVRLIETTSGKKVELPCQVYGNCICFILNGKTPKGTSRHFLLQISKNEIGKTSNSSMQTEDDGKSITLVSGNSKILSYVYSLTMPPEGVDEIYARSGYIHPAFTPSGFELTTIQPEDHRHHYGIWNPWTKLQYAGEEYDLWNLGDDKGTVRAREIISEYSGEVMAGFDAVLNHNIRNKGIEKTIINEIWKVRAWNYQKGDCQKNDCEKDECLKDDCQRDGFLWDFSSELSPSTESPVIIKEYRYAGFGFRANKHWTKDNCEMVSSEGHHRSTIDGTRGRWIYTQGNIGNNRCGGLLIMASPSNYNYPEPLRIWDENAAGVGYVFMNFAPTKNRDWKLESGHIYCLNYRLFAFDGTMTPERAENLWIDFAFPPKVVIEASVTK